MAAPVLVGETEGEGETVEVAEVIAMARARPAGFSVVKMLSPTAESAMPLMRLKTAVAPGPSR